MARRGRRAATVRTWGVALAVGALAGPAWAAPTGASRHVKVELLSDVESVQPGRPFRLGLRMTMDEGWHTYWKNPGDSGLPLRVKWSLPEGVTVGAVQWPVPEAIAAPPLMSYGYGEEVVLPFEVTTDSSLKPGQITLAGAFDWLECKEACLPAKASLDLTLPVRAEAAKPSASAARLDEARRRLPGPADGWSLAAEAGPRAVALAFRPPAGGVAAERAYFFVEQPLVADHAAPQGLAPHEGGHRLTLKPAENAPPPERLRGVLVVEGAKRRQAVEVDVPVKAGDPAPAPVAPAPGAGSAPGGPGSWAVALGFAFVGGLILNLMPCVLPVLSLKVLGFVRQAGEDRAQVLRHGLVFTAGVVLSFWALAGALLVLRAGGERVGWGFQLQSAPVLAGLSVLFLLLGLSLFGVFQIGASFVGAANLLVGRSGLGASFWNGVLATVVATPCTAPFMGSALGFALTQPAWVALSVFTALGLGMSSPYLVLATQPRLLRFVPRPGAWMTGFEQLMGFLLLATVAALVWLFGQQTGVDGVGLLLAALVVVALGAWIHGRAQSRDGSPLYRRAALVAALVLLIGGLGLGFRGAAMEAAGRTGSDGGTTLGGLAWEEYSAVRLAQARAEGKPVFIDFTAAWCLTCQVNERVALARAEVVARFNREGIVALRADWTRRDDHITEALASYGRQGVPVYVLYGRDPVAAPRLLPEVLTPGLVLGAIDEALGSTSTAAVRPSP
jgi:thiol:disulfide interchange protein DsbD